MFSWPAANYCRQYIDAFNASCLSWVPEQGTVTEILPKTQRTQGIESFNNLIECFAYLIFVSFGTPPYYLGQKVREFARKKNKIGNILCFLCSSDSYGDLI